mmetsp:Transcript_5057/g.10247  ORF Transcript_5057/g.10247 Transcript_5057/m.10247 type:complete len:87 (-) Transcript_5057:392-652(-)
MCDSSFEPLIHDKLRLVSTLVLTSMSWRMHPRNRILDIQTPEPSDPWIIFPFLGLLDYNLVTTSLAPGCLSRAKSPGKGLVLDATS